MSVVHCITKLDFCVQTVTPEAAPVRVGSIQPLDNSGSRRKRQAQSESRVKRAQNGLVVLVSVSAYRHLKVQGEGEGEGMKFQGCKSFTFIRNSAFLYLVSTF